jgi:hypothetical protein
MPSTNVPSPKPLAYVVLAVLVLLATIATLLVVFTYWPIGLDIGTFAMLGGWLLLMFRRRVRDLELAGTVGLVTGGAVITTMTLAPILSPIL